MLEGLTAINEAIKEHSSFIPRLKEEIGKVIVGQEELIDGLLIGLLANGHVLWKACPAWRRRFPSRPGAAVGADFQRIQFTPDLLPADLWHQSKPQTGTFTTKGRSCPPDLADDQPGAGQSAERTEAMETDYHRGRDLPAERALYGPGHPKT